jgi:hypothetical protein
MTFFFLGFLNPPIILLFLVSIVFLLILLIWLWLVFQSILLFRIL